MKTRKIINRWGPTSLAVLLAASLTGPAYAQPASEQAAVSSEATAGAEQVAEARHELPRGHFRLPEQGDIIGEYYTVTVDNPEETLIDIARRHNIGYEEIRMANPGVSMWVPGEGTEIVIPAQYILPPAPREGVVVNLSELRLYYYPANNPGIVETYPVSVGRDGFATPVGITRTTVKVKDPAWAPPASMRREAAERGEPAPAIVPPGPDNPLGRHAILLAMPLLHLLPADHALHVSAYSLTLVGKILCYAIVALALDLVWGYAGMLSLGHGLFFALGGYAMGMYLMRQSAGDGLPAFMSFLAWSELPWYWYGTSSFLWAMCLVVLAPGLLALVFGFFAFRSRIKGVYFSIMTQALTFAGMLLFFRNETGFGGNNGFTGFTRILGFDITAQGTRAVLFFATVVLLVGSLYLGFRLARSKFGRVLTALRDAENRLMFCGYDPRGYKLFIWVLSAVLCGLAGALYVPQVGIINPSEMAPTQSIEAAVWVALGGRGTLIGPLLGAGLVNGMKSWFTVAFPEYWLFALGALFIVVTLFLPRGVVGLLRKEKDQ